MALLQGRDRPRRPRRWGRRITAVAALVLVGGVVASYLVAIDGYVYGQGYVMAGADSKVRARQKGRVVEVLVDDGQRVDAGQVLVQLDEVDQLSRLHKAQRELEELRAELAAKRAEQKLMESRRQTDLVEAQAILRNSKIDRERLRGLYQQKQASSREVREADLAVEVGEARVAKAEQSQEELFGRQIEVARRQIATAAASVEAAQIQVEMRKIRAPIAGVLMIHGLEVGEVVDSEQVIGQIFDISSFVIDARTPEWAVAWVKVGQPVRAELSAFPHRQFGYLTGKVTEVRGFIEPRSTGDGYLGVVGLLDASPLDLRPGMSASIRITTGRTRLLWRIVGLR